MSGVRHCSAHWRHTAAQRLQCSIACFSHSSAQAIQISWQSGSNSLKNLEFREIYDAVRLQIAAQSMSSWIHVVILRTSFSSRHWLIQLLHVAAHATSISISEFSLRIFMIISIYFFFFLPPLLLRPAFFFGAFAPFFRASLKPMAIACLRLFTLPPLPPFPDLRVPRFFLRIALSTVLPAFFEYLAISNFDFVSENSKKNMPFKKSNWHKFLVNNERGLLCSTYLN
jgi:hypothetical protein